MPESKRDIKGMMEIPAGDSICEHGNLVEECDEVCLCGHKCSEHDAEERWCGAEGCLCPWFEELGAG